jgi:hypothetical protein
MALDQSSHALKHVCNRIQGVSTTAMWCTTCHQDVPLRQGATAAAVECARCGTPFDEVAQSAADACAEYLSERSPDTVPFSSAPRVADFDSSALEQLLAGPPLPTEDWQLDAEVRDVTRLIDRLRRTTPNEPAAVVRSAPPVPYQPFSESPIPSAMGRMQALASQPPVVKPIEKSSFAAWLLLSLGLATFVCGSVLLGWSFAADRADLWSLGLPLTLAGQAGLILGLVMQLEGLWRSTRQTDQTLSDLDGQLSQLRHATTMLSTTHSTPAQSFYAHMAEGANPQLLMADLKGQLDLLAQQMAANQRRSA